MEIWLRQRVGETDIALDEVDRIFSNDSAQAHLRVRDGVLYQGEQVLGAHLIINDGTTQNDGITHMGTWIGSWSNARPGR